MAKETKEYMKHNSCYLLCTLVYVLNECVELVKYEILEENLFREISLSFFSYSGGITSMKHALLIVGSKILASCGRSPQLPTADTLLLILLTTNLYYHQSNKTNVSEMGM